MQPRRYTGRVSGLMCSQYFIAEHNKCNVVNKSAYTVGLCDGPHGTQLTHWRVNNKAAEDSKDVNPPPVPACAIQRR